MTHDQLRLFILTAEHHSISRAAREFHISQSAASRQLKRLEQDAGMKLFKTSGRGMELTSSGETFLRDISPILGQFQVLEKKYTSSRESITLAASNRPSKYVLPPLIAEFCRSHPHAAVNLYTRSSVAIEKLLAEGKVDFAITTNPTVSQSSFVTESYCREPLVAFVAASHPLARVKSLPKADMGAIPVIIKPRREGESRAEAQLKKFEKQGMKFKTVVHCDSPEVVKEFVRCGAGVGFLYYNSIKRGIERGDFKVIQFAGLDLTGENFIIYPKDKPLSPLVQEFLAFLKAALTKDARTQGITTQLNGTGNGRLRDYTVRPKLLTWFMWIGSLDWLSSVLV